MPLFGVQFAPQSTAFQQGVGQGVQMAAKAQELQLRQQALELDAMQTAANVENIAARTQAQILDNEIQEATKPFDIAEARNRAEMSEMQLKTAQDDFAFDQSLLGQATKGLQRRATYSGLQRKIGEDRIAIELAEDEAAVRRALLASQEVQARQDQLVSQSALDTLAELGRISEDEAVGLVGIELIPRVTEILNDASLSDEQKGGLIKGLQEERLIRIQSAHAERTVDFREQLSNLSFLPGHLPEDISATTLETASRAIDRGDFVTGAEALNRTLQRARRIASNRTRQRDVVSQYRSRLDQIQANPGLLSDPESGLPFTSGDPEFQKKLDQWRLAVAAFEGRDPASLGDEDFTSITNSWNIRFGSPEVRAALSNAGLTEQNTPIPGSEDEVFNFQQFMSIGPQVDPLGRLTTGAGPVDLSLDD